jgi:3-deoxy-D-manno-octulosonic-acid transferase
VFRFFINLIFPIVALIATPFWLLKTRRREGLSQRLWEKLGHYDKNSSPPPTPEKKAPIYLHAVSVGEVNIARKLIAAWSETHPKQTFLLAVSTSTGFDLARNNPSPHTGVIYAPLDFPPFLKACFTRYRPAQIVLIEAEVWPNIMALAKEKGIPVTLANARLSPRSGRRLAKARCMMESSYRVLDWVGAQTESDVSRLEAIGIRPEAIHSIGSIKFDPALATPANPSFDPRPLLESLGKGPLVMALSTHPGEELLFAQAASQLSNARIVIIPRHMERRDEISSELTSAGFEILLRSTIQAVEAEKHVGKILLVDSTGELPAFTENAQLAFVGKTLLSEGGQNPCEAIAARVPLIAGPHFANFEPLATELRNAKGLLTIRNREELTAAMQRLLNEPAEARRQTESALAMLEQHRGATQRTVMALESSR